MTDFLIPGIILFITGIVIGVFTIFVNFHNRIMFLLYVVLLFSGVGLFIIDNYIQGEIQNKIDDLGKKYFLTLSCSDLKQNIKHQIENNNSTLLAFQKDLLIVCEDKK